MCMLSGATFQMRVAVTFAGYFLFFFVLTIVAGFFCEGLVG